MKPKLLTIYTDASHIHQRGISACAWYIRCDAGRLIGSKVCPEEIIDINQAEMYGIAQAIYTASRKWPLSGFDKIIVNTDSQTAIRWLKSEPPHRKVNWRKDKEMGDQKLHVTRRIYMAFNLTLGSVPVEFRHIKGHQGKTNVRNWVNDLVDRESRKAARAHARKQS